MSKLTDKVENKIQKIVQDLEYEIEYTEYVKEGKVNIYRIVIDKEDTLLTTDDMECVSRAVEDAVDSVMPDEAYTLEVSSPGIERQLKNERLYKKYIGSNVKLSLYSKNEITNTKEVEGILKDINENIVTILVVEDEIKIDLKDIASAHTVYNF